MRSNAGVRTTGSPYADACGQPQSSAMQNKMFGRLPMKWAAPRANSADRCWSAGAAWQAHTRITAAATRMLRDIEPILPAALASRTAAVSASPRPRAARREATNGLVLHRVHACHLGLVPSRPSLEATDPVVGRVATLSGDGAPPGAAELVLIGATQPPPRSVRRAFFRSAPRGSPCSRRSRPALASGASECRCRTPRCPSGCGRRFRPCSARRRHRRAQT